MLAAEKARRRFCALGALSLIALLVSVHTGPSSAQAATGGVAGEDVAPPPPPSPQADPTVPATPSVPTTPNAGGAAPGAPTGTPVRIRIENGLAVSQVPIPPALQQIITRGNQIALNEYRYGACHGPFSSIYTDLSAPCDCSGSVSWALGPDFLDKPLASYDFPNSSRVEPGPGQYVTLYTKPDHMYMVIGAPAMARAAGKRAAVKGSTASESTAVRFDTSARKEGPRRGGVASRWTTKMRSSAGYQVFHPKGL